MMFLLNLIGQEIKLMAAQQIKEPGLELELFLNKPADDTLYKITRVLKFFDRAQSPPVNGIGSNLSQFRDGDVVYLIALDQI